MPTRHGVGARRPRVAFLSMADGPAACLRSMGPLPALRPGSTAGSRVMRRSNLVGPARTPLLGHTSTFVFAGTMAALVACGGSTAQEPADDAGGDTNGVNDSSEEDELCSVGSGCIEGGFPASEDSDARVSRDATGGSHAGMLCGYQTGPIMPGQDAGGRIVNCPANWLCVNVDKGWACCTIEGTGGVSLCLP